MEQLYQPFKLSLRDSKERLWALTATAPGRRGVWVNGAFDLSTLVNFTTRATIGQVGESIVGWHVDKMTDTIKLAIQAEEHASVWTLWQQFISGMKPFSECRLIAGSDNAGEVHTPLRVLKVTTPSKSPATWGIRNVEFEIEVMALSGCWYGMSLLLDADKPHKITNHGDFPMWPMAVWINADDARVVSPNGRLSLPFGGTSSSVLDTDPAFAGRILDSNGNVNKQLWRAMKGQVLPSPIMPGETQTWTFEKCKGIIVERFVSMWGAGL